MLLSDLECISYVSGFVFHPQGAVYTVVKAQSHVPSCDHEHGHRSTYIKSPR